MKPKGDDEKNLNCEERMDDHSSNTRRFIHNSGYSLNSAPPERFSLPRPIPMGRILNPATGTTQIQGIRSADTLSELRHSAFAEPPSRHLAPSVASTPGIRSSTLTLAGRTESTDPPLITSNHLPILHSMQFGQPSSNHILRRGTGRSSGMSPIIETRSPPGTAAQTALYINSMRLRNQTDIRYISPFHGQQGSVAPMIRLNESRAGSSSSHSGYQRVISSPLLTPLMIAPRSEASNSLGSSMGGGGVFPLYANSAQQSLVGMLSQAVPPSKETPSSDISTVNTAHVKPSSTSPVPPTIMNMRIATPSASPKPLILRRNATPSAKRKLMDCNSGPTTPLPHDSTSSVQYAATSPFSKPGVSEMTVETPKKRLRKQQFEKVVSGPLTISHEQGSGGTDAPKEPKLQKRALNFSSNAVLEKSQPQSSSVQVAPNYDLIRVRANSNSAPPTSSTNSMIVKEVAHQSSPALKKPVKCTVQKASKKKKKEQAELSELEKTVVNFLTECTDQLKLANSVSDALTGLENDLFQPSFSEKPSSIVPMNCSPVAKNHVVVVKNDAEVTNMKKNREVLKHALEVKKMVFTKFGTVPSNYLEGVMLAFNKDEGNFLPQGEPAYIHGVIYYFLQRSMKKKMDAIVATENVEIEGGFQKMRQLNIAELRQRVPPSEQRPLFYYRLAQQARCGQMGMKPQDFSEVMTICCCVASMVDSVEVVDFERSNGDSLPDVLQRCPAKLDDLVINPEAVNLLLPADHEEDRGKRAFRLMIQKMTDELQSVKEVLLGVSTTFKTMLMYFDPPSFQTLQYSIASERRHSDDVELAISKDLEKTLDALLAPPISFPPTPRPDYGENASSIHTRISPDEMNSTMKGLSPFWKGGSMDNRNGEWLNRHGIRQKLTDANNKTPKPLPELYLEDVEEMKHTSELEKSIHLYEMEVKDFEQIPAYSPIETKASRTETTVSAINRRKLRYNNNADVSFAGSVKSAQPCLGKMESAKAVPGVENWPFLREQLAMAAQPLRETYNLTRQIIFSSLDLANGVVPLHASEALSPPESPQQCKTLKRRAANSEKLEEEAASVEFAITKKRMRKKSPQLTFARSDSMLERQIRQAIRNSLLKK